MLRKTFKIKDMRQPQRTRLQSGDKKTARRMPDRSLFLKAGGSQPDRPLAA
jgi:hypothetical protein